MTSATAPRASAPHRNPDPRLRHNRNRNHGLNHNRNRNRNRIRTLNHPPAAKRTNPLPRTSTPCETPLGYSRLHPRRRRVHDQRPHRGKSPPADGGRRRVGHRRGRPRRSPIDRSPQGGRRGDDQGRQYPPAASPRVSGRGQPGWKHPQEPTEPEPPSPPPFVPPSQGGKRRPEQPAEQLADATEPATSE